MQDLCCPYQLLRDPDTTSIGVEQYMKAKFSGPLRMAFFFTQWFVLSPSASARICPSSESKRTLDRVPPLQNTRGHSVLIELHTETQACIVVSYKSLGQRQLQQTQPLLQKLLFSACYTLERKMRLCSFCLVGPTSSARSHLHITRPYSLSRAGLLHTLVSPS